VFGAVDNVGQRASEVRARQLDVVVPRLERSLHRLTRSLVFFETRRPQADFAARLLSEGVDIGRAFAPLDLWARISIGLPEDNRRARSAVKRALGNASQG
jgi:histidinol-phosphate/aromatic aminotransferase/cobyric acid decarboxylase-like protein